MAFKVMTVMLKNSVLVDWLVQAAMCEIRVVGRGQQVVIAGDVDVEPTMIQCLVQGISPGPCGDL